MNEDTNMEHATGSKKFPILLVLLILAIGYIGWREWEYHTLEVWSTPKDDTAVAYQKLRLKNALEHHFQSETDPAVDNAEQNPAGSIQSFNASLGKHTALVGSIGHQEQTTCWFGWDDDAHSRMHINEHCGQTYIGLPFTASATEYQLTVRDENGDDIAFKVIPVRPVDPFNQAIPVKDGVWKIKGMTKIEITAAKKQTLTMRRP